MSNIKPGKKDIFASFLAGCILGILCFVLVYGIKILDFTYDSWIMCGGVDLKQHYLGFCHLRNNYIRTFPVGIIETLSKPFDMSIIYTDSIPLFALIFRLFLRYLPQTFQYFGLFGIMSFALMGGLSAVLIRKFTDKYFVVICGSLFFILSFPVLQRMYYHTALAAQWIIILAFIMWVYTDVTRFKTWVLWGFIGILCVSIHSYYVFFTGIVLFAQILDYYLCSKYSNDKLHVIRPLFALISFGGGSFFTLYALGAFYGAGEVTKGGFGDFNGNLNGFINPDGFSSIFKPLNYNGMFEYEGFGYLGAGIFLIIAAALIYAVIGLFKAKPKLDEEISASENDLAENVDTKAENDNIKKANVIRIRLMVFLSVVSLLLATVPRFSFNGIQLLNIPLPAEIKRMLGVCRTNGRFIWIGVYLIIVLCLYFVGRHFDRAWIKVVFILAILLQLYDMSGKLVEIHRTYTQPYSYQPVLSELDKLKFFDNKKQFVFMYDGGDLRMDTAYTAYLKRMSQNTFYFARPIDDEINENTEKIKEDFLNGDISKRSIYIFRDEDYTDDFKNAVIVHGAVEYVFDGHVAVVLN